MNTVSPAADESSRGFVLQGFGTNLEPLEVPNAAPQHVRSAVAPPVNPWGRRAPALVGWPPCCRGDHPGGCSAQVLEFVAFKERLERSHSRAVARAESAVYRLQAAVAAAAAKGDLATAQVALSPNS